MAFSNIQKSLKHKLLHIRETADKLIYNLLKNSGTKIREKVLICFTAYKLGSAVSSEIQSSVRTRLHLSP